MKSVLSAHSSEWNVQVWHTITITVTNKVQAKNQTSCLECYQIILSIVHLAMSNCKFSNRNVGWPTMWLQGCRDLHVHHWKFSEDSPYLIILQSFPLPIVNNNNIDELPWVRKSFWHHKIFPCTAITSNKPIISWRHYLLKRLLAHLKVMRQLNINIRSHGTIIVRNHDLSLSVEGKYYTPGKTPPGQTPRGQTPPSRRPLQRTVRILLECFLVLVLCMGAYLSVLPMHFHSGRLPSISVFHFVLVDIYYFHFYGRQTKLREVDVFTSVCLFTVGLYLTPKEPVPPKDHAPQMLLVTRSKRTFPSKTHYPHNKWIEEANIKSEEFHFKDLLD